VKTHVRRVLWWGCAAISVCAVSARAVTGVWTNVSGGYWADSANWQDGIVPSGVGAVADFSALHSGSTVTITNYTGIGAIVFSGVSGDNWTLASTGSGSIGFAASPLLKDETAGEIRVEDGTLTLTAPFCWLLNGIVKSGSGHLRLTTKNDYTGNTRIDGGTLILANDATLSSSTVVFNSADAALMLESDASVGGLAAQGASKSGSAAFDGLKSAAEYNNLCMANGLWIGGVLLVGTRDSVILRQSWGWTSTAKNMPMRADAIFDLASVTKAVGTTTALALCIDRGWLDPDVVFTNYLPGYKGTLRGPVTVRDLARHLSGFNNSKPYAVDGRVTELILEFSPVRPAGEPYEYSCGNFILLGLLVEQLAGKSLAEFCQDNVWAPLAMQDTRWTPLPTPDPRRVVKPPFTPTLGVVSDEPARAAGRPIGNAGLFSTADDLAAYCRMLLGGGVCNGTRILSESSVQMFGTRPDTRSPAAFGWRVSAGLNPSALSAATLSHTGFTGQSVWIDPAQGRFVILLTNRIGDHAAAGQARIELADRVLRALQ